MGLRVAVFLGQTEINHIDLVATLADAHKEVVRLDVTVNERLGVNVFDSRDELIGEEEDRLQGEFAVAEVEQVFQTGSEKVEDHGIVITFGAKPADEGDTNTTSERLIDASFIFELGVLSLDTLELDSNFLAGDDVGSEVDVSETAATDFAANAVFIAYTEIHCSHDCLWVYSSELY